MLGILGGTLSKDPAQELADLLTQELGVTVSPGRLENALVSRWVALSGLAHQIHERHLHQQRDSGAMVTP